METQKEISDRHDDEAISIAIVSQQIAGLKELMLEKLKGQDGVLGIIKEQTIKTNGKVADAFCEIANINAWKNKVIGALIVSDIIVVPLILWLVMQHLHV